MEKDELFERWRWMMDYCKKKKLPPAQEWAWDIAEKEYQTANQPVQPTS